jgi:hypothetical protein
MIHVRHPINPKVPIFSDEWESFDRISVLYLHSADIGILWHVISVTLACKLPERIQLKDSCWPAIAQC